MWERKNKAWRVLQKLFHDENKPILASWFSTWFGLIYTINEHFMYKDFRIIKWLNGRLWGQWRPFIISGVHRAKKVKNPCHTRSSSVSISFLCSSSKRSRSNCRSSKRPWRSSWAWQSQKFLWTLAWLNKFIWQTVLGKLDRFVKWNSIHCTVEAA